MITSRSRGNRKRREVGIERGEELVFREHGGVGERVEQRALARVGVPDDGDDRHPGAVALPPAGGAVAGEPVDARLQRGDALAHAAAVHFQLGLARSTPADAAGQPRERVVAAHQPRQEILELRQLHLELAVGALRAAGEDVEDELGAVEDAQRGGLADVPRLRRRQVVIEDQQIRAQRHGAHQDFLELALPHQRARVDLPPPLQDGVEHLHVGGPRQLAQLLHGGLRPLPVSLVNADEQGAAFHAHRPHRRYPRHLLLEGGDLRLGVELQVVERGRVLHLVQLALQVPGHQRRDVDLARQPVRARLHRGHGVQPQEHEVGEVVAGERLVLEVRVDEAQAAQAGMAGAGAADVRQGELPRVSHDDVLHLAAPVEQDAQLPPRFPRQFGEMARQLGRDQLPLLHPPAPGGEQPLAVAGGETGGISRELLLHLSADM